MRTGLLFLSLLLFLAPGGTARSEGPPLKERVATLRNWRLMEELGLSGKRAERVFRILSRFDEERAGLLKERRRLLRAIRAAVIEGRSGPRLEGLIEEFYKTGEALSRIPRRESEALKEELGTLERARYLLFTQRFARELREMARGARRGEGARARFGDVP